MNVESEKYFSQLYKIATYLKKLCFRVVTYVGGRRKIIIYGTERAYIVNIDFDKFVKNLIICTYVYLN